MLNCSLNAFLCIDLIMTLRYPFSNKERRVRNFIIASFVCSIIATVNRVIIFEFDKMYTRISAILTLTLLMCYFLIVLSSYLFAAFKLCRPGISRKAVGTILFRHVLVTFLYVFTQIYIWSSVIKGIIVGPEQSWEKNSFFLAIKLIFMSQGYLMALVRLSEPRFYSIMIKKFLAYLSKGKGNGKDNVKRVPRRKQLRSRDSSQTMESHYT